MLGRTLWALLTIAVMAAVVEVGPVVADFKSTFLINRDQYSTLSYLSDDRNDHWRDKVEDRILANGDSHVDILGRNTDKEWGYLSEVDQKVLESRLKRLRDKNLAPVIWMRGDDSPEVDQTSLSNQLAYHDRLIEASDAQASHYVIGLEVDEYWSPTDTQVAIQRARQKTSKPIGVHLSPTSKLTDDQVRAYIKNADIWYVQVGFSLSEEQFRAEIERAIALADGKPIVISEYHLDGTSAEAKRLGDIACSYSGKGNIVGTGNGRGGGVCKSLAWALDGGKPKEEWYDKWDDELAVFSLALVTLSAVNMLNLPFTTRFNYATESGYEIMTVAPVTEDLDVGMTFRDDGKTMGFLRGNFNVFKNLFKGNAKSTQAEIESRR